MAFNLKQMIIAVVMVVTGSINTLSTKWADRELAPGTADNPHHFDHPFFQAVGMFLGEMMCMVVYIIMFCSSREGFRDRQTTYGGLGYNPLIFLPASLCDMTGTSLMYIGLNLTYASSFQMLRGAVIIFTALLSVAFLGRTIRAQMWIGIVFVIMGLAVVGLSDILLNHGDKTSDVNGIIAGDLLIIMAQIIVSVQMVYEEKVINRYKVHPLECVGWEGIYGFFILGLLLIPFYYIDAGAFSQLPTHRLDDAIDAFHQLGQNWKILMATLGNIFSIAFFNFAGISVTQQISATTRMVLDSVRTIIIWIVALLLSWQDFTGYQVLGFVVLVWGMMLYNDIGIQFLKRHLGRIFCRHRPVDEERESLINSGRGNNIQVDPNYLSTSASNAPM